MRSASLILNYFVLVPVVTIVCLPEVCSVLQEVLTCVPTWEPSTRDLAHWICVWGLFRGLFLVSVPDDGCQFVVLAGPKDPNNFLGDFRVPLVIYNESVPLFL